MRLLDAVAHAGAELSIGELSHRLRLHKSVVSRLVSSLHGWRMLEKDPVTKRVGIGVGAFQIGTQFLNRHPLHRLALPHLGALVERTRHSSHVGVLDEPRLIVIASVDSPQALRVILKSGEARYLHATASGKLLLAYGRQGLLESVVRAVGLPALTAKTITSESRLRRELAVIRQLGIATNVEEYTRGAGAVAAPIFGAAGAIIAALCTVFPTSVVDRRELKHITECVRQSAATISAVLGAAATGNGAARSRGRSAEWPST